jgi:hypothetical protein
MWSTGRWQWVIDPEVTLTSRHAGTPGPQSLTSRGGWAAANSRRKLAAPGHGTDTARQWVDGQVAEREFLGEFIRYTVQVGITRLIIDSTHYAGEPSFAPGNAVAVGVHPGHARLLTA